MIEWPSFSFSFFKNHQVFQSVRKGSCREEEEPWRGEGAEIPWCWAGGNHCGAPTSTIPGKTKNSKLLCGFVVDMCSTRDFHIFSWRNFPSCQQEPLQTLWKQEIYCKAQKLIRFNQWEIQHSNTLNMEEQQKRSKKRSGMSESCTSSSPRIKKTEQVFCLFFYFIKKTHKNPLGPRVHLHFRILKVYSIEVTLMMYYLSAEPSVHQSLWKWQINFSTGNCSYRALNTCTEPSCEVISLFIPLWKQCLHPPGF